MKKVIFFSTAILCVANISAQTQSFMHDGIERTFEIHFPPSFSQTDTLPLVLSLHGLTQNGPNQKLLSEFDPIADRENFIVVYPNGINASWNTFTSPYHSGVDDVGFLSALIDSMYAWFHIDLDRVYSTGMSNGGFMSYRLACELSDRIAAIASVTGSMTDSMLFYCSPTRPVPVMHFHGTSDAIVSYNGIGNVKSVDESLQYWVGFNHCPTPPVETSVADINTLDLSTAEKIYWGLCDEQTEVIHYRILNGGHTWPGSGWSVQALVGVVNQDINASELIWEFFSKYSLTQSTTSSRDVESSLNTVKVFPNPTNDAFSIYFKAGSVSRFTFTDIAGKIFFENLPDDSKNSITIQTGHLQPGMYLLICESENSSITQKILVTK